MLKVVFPLGSTENGTSVGDIKPIVLNGANIFEVRCDGGAMVATSCEVRASSFRRFVI
jgi:hypothetical protein